VKEAALGVAEETGINRFVLILGEPGTGKTTAMQHLAQTWGAKLVMMEATEPMRNSLQAFLAGLWMAVGVVVERKSAPPPANANACLVGLMEQLREVRKIIAIDEGHHLGPAALNTIKSLINSTGVAFMVAAKPDLFARLQCAAYSECSQLTRNRLHARVRLDNPPPKDLAQMITQSLHLAEDEDATEFAALLTEGCRRFGAWNWAALVCRRCRALTRGKGEVTKAIFKDAIARCESTR
jgi:DNA transposition AAA+ family ATPase